LSSQPIRADALWPTEEPTESVGEIIEEKMDKPGSEDNGSTDVTQTASARPEQKDSTGSEEQRRAVNEGNDSPESDCENPTEPEQNGPKKSKGPTEEQKTVSQETEVTNQEKKAIRVAASEREAREANRRRFPQGCERIPVSGHGLLCGPRALIESIVAQDPELLYPPPTIEELQELLTEDPVFQEFNETSKYDSPKEDANNIRADQLAGLLHAWGRKHDPDLNLRLGFVRPLQADFLFPAPDGKQKIIWVFNNDAQSETEGIYGHYEGLRPRVDLS
jgi:hypothetical protein